MSVVWLESRDIRCFHRELIIEHGGLPGPANPARLESTLARPRNLVNDSDESTIAVLAASYGYGFSKNHCFPGVNKRIALVAIDVFLAINGHELVADEADAVMMMRQLAAGQTTEHQLSAWISANSGPD